MKRGGGERLARWKCNFDDIMRTAHEFWQVDSETATEQTFTKVFQLAVVEDTVFLCREGRESPDNCGQYLHYFRCENDCGPLPSAPLAKAKPAMTEGTMTFMFISGNTEDETWRGGGGAPDRKKGSRGGWGSGGPGDSDDELREQGMEIVENKSLAFFLKDKCRYESRTGRAVHASSFAATERRRRGTAQTAASKAGTSLGRSPPHRSRSGCGIKRR